MYLRNVKCGSSSVGRASASQAEGRGFEPRLPLCILRDEVAGLCDEQLVYLMFGVKGGCYKFNSDFLSRNAKCRQSNSKCQRLKLISHRKLHGIYRLSHLLRWCWPTSRDIFSRTQNTQNTQTFADCFAPAGTHC